MSLLFEPMFDARFPPDRATRKLFGRLQAELSPDEQVMAAVALVRGPRPGSEAALPIVGALLGLWAFALAALGLAKYRRHYILAATVERAILFRSTWLGRPTEVAENLSLSEIGTINDATGDLYVEVAGERYWISGFVDQLYRLRRVIAAHGSGHPEH